MHVCLLEALACVTGFISFESLLLRSAVIASHRIVNCRSQKPVNVISHTEHVNDSSVEAVLAKGRNQ